MATGKGHPGKETGYELKAKLQQLIGDTEIPDALVDNNAKIRFQVANSVPENWISLVPTHIDNQMREIQLQRAAMPRILENDDKIPLKVEPRTSLTREGLEETPKAPFVLHKEEINRDGTRVRKPFQRTRWFSCKVYNWVGIKKQLGRGEGSGSLAFDQLVRNRNFSGE